MKSDQHLLSEFTNAMEALASAQATEQPVFQHMCNMPPERMTPELAEKWYRLNEVTSAARQRVDLAVRALFGVR